MNLRLRARLLLSYVVLLSVTLAVITLALVLFIAAQPVSPNETYNQLTTLLREILPANQNSTEGPLARLIGLETQLQEFATANEVRALIVNLSNNVVRFDSAGVFSRGDSINTELETYTLPLYLRRGLPVSVEPLFGGFTDSQGVRWAFVGLVNVRQGVERLAVVLADRLPAQMLEAVINRFRSELLLPLCQAALLGLVISLALAVLISRNLMRSLQLLAEGASAVAKGRYDQRVPETGVPEVRAVAAAFNQMSGEIQNTRQSQQDFVANVSHDLKTPLTSIQGYSQAIMEGAAKDPSNAAKVIHEEASRLNRMVTELTDLARLQSGRLSMRTVPVDVAKLTQVIGERLSILAHDKGITLHVQTSALPPVSGDGDRLAQVLTNLLSNAIKYTPEGGQIWLTAQLNDTGLELIVRDTGVGIPAKELPRVFERFYQVDKARGPRRGTGLGLAITQEIVQAHGGRISVTSPGVNQGSTFIVWLPITNTPPTDRPPRKSK